MGIEDNNMENRLSKMEDRQLVVEKKLIEVSMNQQQFLEVMKSNNENQKELNKTMLEVQLTMKDMQAEIKNNSESVTELQEDVKSLKTDVRSVDNKGKFDVVEYLKLNLIPIVIGVAMLLHISGIIK